MKRISLLVLLVAGFLLAGCQSTSYRWINKDHGMSSDCLKTYYGSSKVIEYCLVPDSDSGDWYFEGIARSRGAHTIGRIAEGGFYLVLGKDGKVVNKTRLYRQGDNLDKAINLRKAFQFNGDFNQVWFTWNLRYYR